MRQNVSLPEDTIKQVKEVAKKCCRSINQQANYWIKLGIQQEAKSLTNTVGNNLASTLKEDILKCIANK